MRVVSGLSWKLGPEGQVLTPESQELLLAWVNDHGLLGLLESEILQLSADVRPKDGEGTEQSPNWQVVYNSNLSNDPDFYPLLPEMLPPTTIHAIEAVARGIEDKVIRTKPWEKVAEPFLPDYPLGGTEDTSFYPVPGYPGFLENYAEPVDRFISAANVLRRISDEIARLPRVRGEEKKNPESDFDAVVYQHEALVPLRSLLSLVQLDLSLDADGSLKSHYRSSSLLGILAIQLHSDLTGGKGAFHECGQCPTSFFSTGYQATYCSAECRLAAVRENRRQKK